MTQPFKKTRYIPPEGQLRQSQLITTFGPGAMVDLVDRSVVIGGLEHWPGADNAESLDDARLRQALVTKLKAIDPDLTLEAQNYFRKPPVPAEDFGNSKIGVFAHEFPRWFVCQGCRRLARAKDAFETKKGRYHHACDRGTSSRATPVRFVAACKRGHLSDFPWVAFCHASREGHTCDRPELYLTEGATGDFGRIIVKCGNCNAQAPMSQHLAYSCDGDRPWLGGKEVSEPCDQQLKLLVRTGSDAYFSQVVSALRLPPPKLSEVREAITRKDIWDDISGVKDIATLTVLLANVPRYKQPLGSFAPEEVWKALEEARAEAGSSEQKPLRTAEFERLISAPLEAPGTLPEPGATFAAFTVPHASADLPEGVAALVVVPEVREVRVQMSFSRFDSVNANLQGEFDVEAQPVRPAPLTLPGGSAAWLPAVEVRGEGVFIRLDEKAITDWLARPAVVERGKRLLQAFDADQPGQVFPGLRFYLLHSLSHLLLTTISLECGYSASSLRERIFCSRAGDTPQMAGILITTGTTGSEGTLGGLVEEGRRMRHHLRHAWELGRLCSNDPVCAAHDPASKHADRRTEGAACHGCLYVSEPSCERHNRYLDRALVVPTLGNDPTLAFFTERP